MKNEAMDHTRQAASTGSDQVKVWETSMLIPTYDAGEADPNPMFLEKRVYQGSSGRVYPHPVIESISDVKHDKNYKLVILENEYIRIEIMPEIGGRIYRALDKTNNYDFVYYNRVIKPALVGLAGPWISGGIEFNWPQHHRPNTFGPVEYKFEATDNGSATVWVSEIDRMYGTKVTAAFKLYPGKAYLEINAQLYNRTPESQTFLWWANPAVAVNDHTQSVFPPDVTAVFDHGKRDVSRFPIATGTYYKQDYSEGVDISRYKNIPVPTSYMAYKSDYNFVGGYDHGVEAGLLHVANHHISPGKKQWTWGNGEFGQAWDRQLTDEDGPYIELMTGVYTDNQPDFTWLQPYEEKTFTQYFMPYKNIGVVKNASIEAAINLEVDAEAGQAVIKVYATYVLEHAVVELSGAAGRYLQDTVDLSPVDVYQTVVTLNSGEQESDLKLSVRNAEGRLLISYQPKRPDIERVPEAAKPLATPEELRSTEELYLAGLHLEQYRHATFEPEAYYLEGLKRDNGDIRLNVAYGTLLLRRGLYTDSEKYFRKAIERLTWRNPNPYDSEAYYQLGVALRGQKRFDEAFTVFHKAVWSAAWQDAGYFSLAQISSLKGQYAEALEQVERSLIRNSRNYKARNLKTAMLRKLGQVDNAKRYALQTLELDVADFGAFNELALAHISLGDSLAAQGILSELQLLMRNDAHNYLNVIADYMNCGLYEEAIAVGERLSQEDSFYPMLHYALGTLYEHTGQHEQAQAARRKGQLANPAYCFPNTLFEIELLASAVHTNPEDDKAHYYLGNLYYDKKRPVEAIASWEQSRRLRNDYPTVHRNLGLAYYNKQNNPQAALASLEQAFACAPEDVRILFELDQLRKKLAWSTEERLHILEERRGLVEKRDDLYVEYVTLLNNLGRYQDAIAALSQRNFHPWEGGEGKVTGQYKFAHTELGKQALQEGHYEAATQYLHQALVYPLNLGEGKLEGAQENNIYYYLGMAYEGLQKEEEAVASYTIASRGLAEPTNAMFYNDQPPELIFYQGLAWLKLHNEKEAKRRFNKLIDYAEKHIFDDIKIDYFAVSLPDFLVFEDDLNRHNVIHCRYMRGLGLLGLGRDEEAGTELELALEMEPNHQGVMVHRRVSSSTAN
ncbi:tetratricopeptide repeat protein [Paenibacillus sp. FSL M7-1046]|uniref:tetratricopeptide repeat protein n=1 Tax=Paenibacillus sp. FSL M7-1046 TaxID=2975315 RepID=UPI0030FC0748